MTETDDIAGQLVQMQIQLAHQEETVRELNEALALQQQEILVLRRQLQLLKLRQDEQEQAEGGPAEKGGEKPPHY